MIYDGKAVSMEHDNQTLIFNDIIAKYPYVEHAKVFCAKTNNGYSVVYPLREFRGDEEVIITKLKQYFLFRRELGIMDKEINADQVYCRDNYVPVVMPSATTVKRDTNTLGGYEGVVIENNVLRIVDLDKAYASGKYMYIINFYQTYEAIFGIKAKKAELF
jgi:hypothetical protein